MPGLIYALSKAFWLVAQPGNLLALLALLGAALLFTGWRRLGRCIIVLLALSMAAIAALPVGDWILRPLENRFPPLTQLPEREREALILQKYHGWTQAQIAAHLGCTAGAVAGLHARGLKRLRELLPDLSEEE